MNLTSIGNTHSNLPAWKRFKAQYVATAGALALAASAAFAFSPGESQKAVAPTEPRVSVAAFAQPKPIERQFFYLVADETERGALQYEGAQNVLIAGSREAQILLKEGTRDMDENYVPYSIFDLTVQSSANTTAPVIGPAVTSVQASAAEQPRVVVYVVDSQAGRDALISQGKQYIVVITPEAIEASDATQEILALNSDALVVKFTGQSFASDADIMGGVVSTEYAMWGAPQSASQPRVASEADIMGGVLSTEYATWGAPR